MVKNAYKEYEISQRGWRFILGDRSSPSSLFSWIFYNSEISDSTLKMSLNGNDSFIPPCRYRAEMLTNEALLINTPDIQHGRLAR